MTNLTEETVPRDHVLDALRRLLNSRVFVQSPRLSAFLRLAVEETLDGNGSSLKEYTIGTQAYGRRAEFDPSQDTIVRTEARRLKRKLKEYYDAEGENDPVVIFFRPGNYIPIIRWRHTLAGSQSEDSAAGGTLWTKGDGVQVAVAAFEAHPADAVAASFAFGATEELLHKLTRVRGLRLLSAVPQRTGLNIDPTHGPEKKVPDILLDGTVRSDQNRLRVTARVTTSSGLVLWSQRFDTSAQEDLLLHQQEAIAAALISRIAPRESVVQKYAGSPTPTLYSLYAEALAAEALVEEGSISNITTALGRFQELSRRFPEYPRLHCGVGQCCVALAQRGVAPSHEYVQRAEDACLRALAIDPETAEAHSTLGCVNAQRWNWKAADERFRTALRFGSAHTIHRQYAVVLMACQRADEAWQHLSAAQELDPFSARQKTSMARHFYCTEDTRGAESYFRSTARSGPISFEATYFRTLLSIHTGDLEAARTMLEDIRAEAPRVPPYRAAIAELLALCGNHEEARAIVAQDGLLNAEAKLSSFRKATLALALKDLDKAMECLEQSMSRKEAELPWLRADPRFHGIRDHAIVKSILKTVFPE